MLGRRKTYLYILLLLIFPFITGCPYESKIPVGNKEQAVFDPDLEGTWFSRKDKNGSKSIISRTDKNEYLIKHYKESENKIDITEFNAYIVKLGNDYFVNVYEPNIHYTSGGFLIFRIDKLNPSSIKITELDRYKAPLEFTSKDELHKFLLENINNKTIFAESEIWDKKN